jgi:hypothetical protein
MVICPLSRYEGLPVAGGFVEFFAYVSDDVGVL